jgi:hypothetical protein
VNASASLTRWQNPALLVGVVASALSLVGAFLDHPQFFHSYLFAWLFWSGISFGSIVVLTMQFLTGGLWGLALRNLALAALATVPLVGLLFLPVLFGMREIYSWANGALGETGAYHHKAQWLNIPFFTARSIFYLALLVTIALLLRRWSLAQSNAKIVPTRIRTLSATGLIAYVLCMNFASVDWAMSLDPQWYSTIFVIIFVTGHFLGALAFLTALLAWEARDQSLGDAIPAKVFNDLGSMLLAFVIFWTYVAFSQYLIIWSGNLPKEIDWYLQRSQGGWKWFAVALLTVQFLLPFALLLSRAAKRNKQRLFVICVVILLANILANFWLVAPSFHPTGIHVHWLDATVWLALGGFWCALFLRFVERRPWLPRELLEESDHD